MLGRAVVYNRAVKHLAALLVLLAFPSEARAAEPVCGPAGDEPLRREVLAEVNELRREAGSEPLTPHPALCEVARWRAGQIASSGSPSSDRRTLEETERRLHRAGYAAHRWTEGTLLGGGPVLADVLDQWLRLKPEWGDDLLEGDFEHLGIAVDRHRDQPVYALLLALPRRTYQLREAAPLADVEAVRRRILAAVNQAREAAGRKPVKLDGKLNRAAQDYAEEMLRRAFYGHESPEGEDHVDRIRATGRSIRGGASENVAKGLMTPEEVVRRWLDSPGHRRNILRRGARSMGAGVAFGDNANGFEVLWVQLFTG